MGERRTLIMSPPSGENDLPICSHCGEYLANHWRGRPCLAATESRAPLTQRCFRGGGDTLIEVGAGCVTVGLHEEP